MSSGSKTKNNVNSDDTGAGEESKEADVVEEIVKDNLEIMLEIVMIIRNDAAFAKSIYANCPRLQHLLDMTPEIRPIFEDPALVRSTS
jgi:hypothetical protein